MLLLKECRRGHAPVLQFQKHVHQLHVMNAKIFTEEAYKILLIQTQSQQYIFIMCKSIFDFFASQS